jgi:hypothetical protein
MHAGEALGKRNREEEGAGSEFVKGKKHSEDHEKGLARGQANYNRY